MVKYFISHFSGCGGSTSGAVQAGFEPLLGIDNNETAARIYKNNFRYSKFLNKKIQDVTDDDLTDVYHKIDRQQGDILVLQTSPPCQDFSNANVKNIFNADRANLLKATYWQYEYFKPEYIILENVPSYKDTDYYENFENFIYSLGYRCSLKILNAAEYGVPQNRSRMFAAFSRDDVPFINLNHLTRFNYLGWFPAVEHLIDELEETFLTGVQLKAISQHKDYGKSHLLIERVGYYGTPKIRTINQPCWCLRSHLANDGKHGNGRSNIINIVLPNGIVKKVNTTVLARFQAFPNNFLWSERFVDDVTAIGNAVSPGLMKQVCELITL
jgi:DNA (cytosine-5)-methyltransferase 1